MFFDNLTQEQINNLTSGFFGIYINSDTEPQTRQNIVKLLPHIWESVDEEVKHQFGIKYANFVANNYPNERQLARDFLKVVESESFIPLDLRVVEIEQTLDSLLLAHRSTNNFYSEPTFMRQLKSIVGVPPKIPKNIERKFILGMVEVFLTNAYGTAVNAEPYYKEMLRNLDEKGSTIAAFSFLSDEIASKLQFRLCSQKYREMLGILKNNISSTQVREVVEKIEKTTGLLDNLRVDTQLKRQLRDLRIMR